jgi:hypothetical protein
MTCAIGSTSCSNWKLLRQNFFAQLSDPCYVTPGVLEASDEAEPDRVGAKFEDDWDGRCCRLCRKRARRTGRSDHGHMMLNEVSSHARQLLTVPFRPAVLDCNVLPLDKSGLFQTLAEGC